MTNKYETGLKLVFININVDYTYISLRVTIAHLSGVSLLANHRSYLSKLARNEANKFIFPCSQGDIWYRMFGILAIPNKVNLCD